MVIRALFITCSLIVLSITSLYASDISRDVRAGRSARIDDTATYSGYLEFSGGVHYKNAPVNNSKKLVLELDIGGHFRYKRFFIDALAESYNQAQFGYNVYSDDTWSIDLLSAVSDTGINSALSEELSEYKERDPSVNLGVRGTAYAEPYIFQIEAMQDVSDTHDGHQLTAYFARNWLLHNWNLHALLGARYESGKVLDYQYGIDADQASEQYGAYQAGSGATLVTELGLTYPLSQNIVFKTTARRWMLPESVTNSPFITDDEYISVTAKLTYVY